MSLAEWCDLLTQKRHARLTTTITDLRGRKFGILVEWYAKV